MIWLMNKSGDAIAWYVEGWDKFMRVVAFYDVAHRDQLLT